jgi:hypothetical protein
MDTAFGATGNHHVRISRHDEACGVSDAMRTGRARCRDCVIRTLETIPHRDVRGTKVDEEARDKQGVDFSVVSGLAVCYRCIEQVFKIADT